MLPLAVVNGSSPLARGLHYYYNEIGLESGIIPARAGFTHEQWLRMTHRRDHPRSRGVYSREHVRDAFDYGSSPLARGLQPRTCARRLRLRIIPARAGFTRGNGSPTCPPPDHPRSRGVYLWRWTPERSAQGSSPLARGLPFLPRPNDRGVGIIPARAGFTRSVGGTGYCEQDHPRSRGVYVLLFWNASPNPGSSPLARGLQACSVVRWEPEGIIPARAGFTPSA